MVEYLVDSLTLADWLALLLITAGAAWAVCTSVLLVALLPLRDAATRWRIPLLLPHRAGTASWRELHPAWMGSRSSIRRPPDVAPSPHAHTRSEPRRPVSTRLAAPSMVRTQRGGATLPLARTRAR